jgi:hypothetical protein
VPSLSRQVVLAELQEVRRIGGHDHFSSGKLPRHDSDVIALLTGSAPVHGNPGDSVGHSFRSRIHEKHILRLAGLLGFSVELVVVDELGAELEGITINSVAVVSEETIHVVVQFVLAHLEKRWTRINQIADDIFGDASVKLNFNISEVVSQGLCVLGKAIHIISQGEVGSWEVKLLEGVGAGQESRE